MSDESATESAQKVDKDDGVCLGLPVLGPPPPAPIHVQRRGPAPNLVAAQRALRDALWDSGLVDKAIERVRAIIAAGGDREAIPAARLVLEYAAGKPSQAVDVAIGGAVGHYSMADMQQAQQALRQADTIEGEGRDVTEEQAEA